MFYLLSRNEKDFFPLQMPSIKKCVAVGCNTDQDSKITLFSIPRPLPESWRKFLSVSDLNSKTKLCEKHFKKCDIVCMGPNKKLREGAEPINPLDENLVNEICSGIYKIQILALLKF